MPAKKLLTLRPAEHLAARWHYPQGTRDLHRQRGNRLRHHDTSNGEVLWVYQTRISPNVMHVKAEWLGLIDGQPRSWNESHFEYAHRDHLGSIEVVTDDSGAELHRLAFEPFGSRRSEDWSGNITASELNGLLARGQGHAPRVRGFTGHEHLDRTGFIHMNGRIYDPVLGRFLSPDPFVQFPAFSQNWNRYSYVNNSPTSFTDPTGYRADLRAPVAQPMRTGMGGREGYRIPHSPASKRRR